MIDQASGWRITLKTNPGPMLSQRRGLTVAGFGSSTEASGGRSCAAAWCASMRRALVPFPRGSEPRLPNQANHRPMCALGWQAAIATRKLNCHIAVMLKLVESLAVKAERAKKTTVQFIPIRDRGTGTHKCNWCETVVRGKRKGWNSYHATERLGPTTELRFDGDVCPREECRISLQAKYIR